MRPHPDPECHIHENQADDAMSMLQLGTRHSENMEMGPVIQTMAAVASKYAPVSRLLSAGAVSLFPTGKKVLMAAPQQQKLPQQHTEYTDKDLIIENFSGRVFRHYQRGPGQTNANFLKI